LVRGDVTLEFSAQIIAWQHRHGRHTLPWQNTQDPYRVWLSEIMLQQTQVATVRGYFERFLNKFPNVEALATASLDEVLALWSGLGYYSRARNLHRCAQTVAQHHGGQFPRSSAKLVALPGIGRSTAAAIAAFCFAERVAILDGNVKRVLTRVLGFGADLAQAANERALWTQATELLPHAGIERYTQGLMDLGATVCSARTPLCAQCPVQSLCVAAQTHTQTRFPVKTRKLKRSTREHVWLWLSWRDQVWLIQRPPQGIWAGLWSLPEFDSLAALLTASSPWPGAMQTLPSFTHTLTHLDWTLHPVRWSLPEATSAQQAAQVVNPWADTGRWFTAEEAMAVGLPAPLRKLLGD
jgi:A/G-specific adenine glycosylase